MILLSPQLEAFLEITKSQTVHGAAKELGITPTGVTQRIRSLESSLSTTLFTRSRKGMRLTDEGKALLRYCLAARDLEGETLAGIHKAGREVEARISLTGPTSILESRIVPQCLPVMKEFPELLVTFRVNDLEARIEDLRNGSAQLAILPRELVARKMDSRLLRAEEYVLVATTAWKKRPLKKLLNEERIIDFDSTDRMTHRYLREFGLLDLASAERHFVNNNRALVEMFEAGMGYGVLTTEVAKPKLLEGSLVALNTSLVYRDACALAWYPRPQMPSYFRALVKAIK